jgi:hypothetical protein
MTQNEIMMLLGRKIDEARINELESRFAGLKDYYAGVQEGLKQAKTIVGMLGSNHNHLKK